VNQPLTNVTPVPPPKRPNRQPLYVGAVVLLALLLGLRLLHHDNPYERAADDITRAIANNDMTPVIHDFNAINRPELTDRGRVGRLSDMVVALGAFKGSKEITPANSPAGFHEFTEDFANGTLDEKYQLDADDKIVKFHIGPPTPP
jgi:hypothetical protein